MIGEVELENQLFMKELNKYDLEDLYPIFSKNITTRTRVWDLTKEGLEEMHVDPDQSEKYFQKLQVRGR